MTLAYQFKPHERPVIPGSPFNPDHPTERMFAYGFIGVLAGLTGGLGNALVTSNLIYFQGTLGLTAEQVQWSPAAYATTYICANLVLVKFRQQFGLQLFLRLMLVGYIVLTAAHLVIQDFWSAIVVRAMSGIAAAGLSTLGVLTWFQAMPAPKRLYGLMIGVSVPQLATPLARVLAPSLLEWGDWRVAYVFELGLALLTLAAVLILPLPPSERSKVFERTDFVTIALLLPGVGLLCSVLALGRTVWWLEREWIGWAMIGAILLISSAFWIEHRRSNPLLMTRFIGQWPIVRVALVAFCIRVVLAEQTFGAVGLLSSLGYGTEQIRTLFIIVTLASIAGLLVTLAAMRPQSPARPIQLACLLIAVAAWLDSGATSLTHPADLYLSQALVGFAGLMFIGPAFVIGMSRALLGGPQYFISLLVVFLASQNLGGLVGTALFGTVETAREKFHSNILTQQIRLDNPIDANRLAASAQQVAGVITDPALRSAEGSVLVGQKVTREANVLAYNDVFLIIAVLAFVLFLWGIVIEINMRKRGEISPIVRLAQAMAAKITSAQNGGPRS
ncbi:MFS transporter [Sphingomonas limnosediminicola]|uniref:MFS transporter n=1 Tax=Sphingomonas limnosediminicola TaxID=940133 RepID=A0ABP7LMV2_9SPHN